MWDIWEPTTAARPSKSPKPKPEEVTELMLQNDMDITCSYQMAVARHMIDRSQRG